MDIELIACDTFGTVADWFTGVSAVLRELFPDVDAAELTLAWRSAYSPALASVESGEREWTPLDDLHRESLIDLLAQRGIDAPSNAELDLAVRAWHKIPAWEDSLPGLRRLKRHFIVAPLSNGSVELLTRMAKINDLPWDFIGGSDLWRHYKPAPETYLGLAGLFGLEPPQVLMVATHHDDLDAARSYGLRTAYVERPQEYGPRAKCEYRDPRDLYHARSFTDLAEQILG